MAMAKTAMIWRKRCVYARLNFARLFFSTIWKFAGAIARGLDVAENAEENASRSAKQTMEHTSATCGCGSRGAIGEKRQEIACAHLVRVPLHILAEIAAGAEVISNCSKGCD